ncbi:MAG: hypothetical protein AABX61_01635 [Nanoarchaeota archaeon]
MGKIKNYFNNLFKNHTDKGLKEEKPKSEGYCNYCKKKISNSEEHYCSYCKKHYCFEHRMPSRHSLSAKEKCPGDV